MEDSKINETASSRCKVCGLPSNFVGISFDSSGVCNFCASQKDSHYLGLELLKKDIDAILINYPNRSYDCAVAFSGGRDSSYLLYFAKVVLGLKVLAVSLDHDFIPPETRANIKAIVKNLDIDIHIIKNEVLNKSSRISVHNWAKRPDTAMLLTFCTGCRHGIKKVIPAFVRQQGIPILLVGDTPFEGVTNNYHVNLLSDDKSNVTNSKLIRGFAKRLIKNPSYIFSVKTLYNQYLDFVSYRKKTENDGCPQIIKPFYHYIEWKEEEIISKLKEIGWGYNQQFTSTWRSDCFVNLLRQYFYKKDLGYNDIDVYYARLLRKGMISESEAMQYINSESEYDDNIIRDILKDYYDVDYDDVCKKLAKRKK